MTTTTKLDLRGLASPFGAQGISRLPYPTDRFDFSGKVSSLLIDKGYIDSPVPLEDLHLHLPAEAMALDDHGLSPVGRAFYDTDDAFIELYRGFLREFLVGDVLGYDVIFQETPTVRFLFPGPFPAQYKTSHGRMLGVHSDTMLGHPFEEINVWLPVTEAFGTNAMVLSNLEEGIALLEEFLQTIDHDGEVYFTAGRGRFLDMMRDDANYQRAIVKGCPPYPMQVGEVLLFDPRCLHGTDENREAKTRISLDFRLIPVEAEARLTREYKSAGRSGRLFARGDVYFAQSVNELP